MIHRIGIGTGFASCDRCRLRTATLTGDVKPQLLAIGWIETRLADVTGRWFCPACKSRHLAMTSGRRAASG